MGVTVENTDVEITMGAIVDGSGGKSENTRYDIEVEDVYGLQGAEVNILCKSNFPAEYCWFRHPSGRKIPISVTPDANEGENYRYFGSGIHLGDCGVSILKASLDDSGTWSCHMGTIQTAGIESSKQISVRVSGKRASTPNGCMYFKFQCNFFADSHLVSSSLFQDVQSGTALLLVSVERFVFRFNLIDD